MRPVPQVRVSAYLPFLDYVEGQGAAFRRHIDNTVLRAVAERDTEALVPVHLAHALLENCARTYGASDFGYTAGRGATVEGLGAFGRSLLRSLTLHDALGKILSTFGHYSSAERLWWQRSGESVEFLHSYRQGMQVGSIFAQQCALILMRDLIRVIAGPDWQPQTVFVTSGQDLEATRLAFCSADVQVAEFSGFVFPAELLSRPFARQANSKGISGHDPAAFERSAPASDFVGAVKQTIAALMPEGGSLELIANALGVHQRMLQRMLCDCETDFSQLLSEVRFEAAARLLDDPGLRVIDVACELGYADSANFTRAFLRWTGVSPSDFRRLRQKSLS